jgi:hypothetical protein
MVPSQLHPSLTPGTIGIHLTGHIIRHGHHMHQSLDLARARGHFGDHQKTVGYYYDSEEKSDAW